MTRILGVDFSGASDAGRKIWIAEGQISGNGAVQLSQCVPAMALPAGGIRPEQAVPALAHYVATFADARVGSAGLLRVVEHRGGIEVPHPTLAVGGRVPPHLAAHAS